MGNRRVDRICNIQYSMLQAMNMFVSAVLSAFLVPLLQSQGFSAGQIGILIAIKCCALILFSPIYASIADRIADRVSNRVFIAIFCVAGIIITVMHICIPLNFAGAVLIFVGYGATFSCIGPFTDSLSSQYVARGVKINYAFARAMGSLFWALAGLVLGYLTTKFPSESILWLQIGALVACMLVALIAKDPNKISVEIDTRESGGKNTAESNQADRGKRTTESNQADRGKRTTESNQADCGEKTKSLFGMLKENPFYTCYLVALLFMMTGVNMTMSYMAYTVSGVGAGSQELGMYEFVLGFMEVFVGFYFLFFFKRLGTRKLMLVSMIGMVLRVAFLTIAGNMWMVYFAQIFELIGCMLWASNVKLVETEIPIRDRVKGQAVIGTVQTGLSVLTASMLGGQLMEHLNDVFYIHGSALILGVIGIAIFIIGMRIFPLVEERNPSLKV